MLKISGETLIALGCWLWSPVRQCTDIWPERFILECRCETAGTDTAAIALVSRSSLLRRFGGKVTTARRSVVLVVSLKLVVEIMLSPDS